MEEQALWDAHRTDGFRVPSGHKMCGFAYAKSGCSSVGGEAKWRKSALRFLERSCITGGARGISHSRLAAATHPTLVRKRFSFPSEVPRSKRWSRSPSTHKYGSSSCPTLQVAWHEFASSQNQNESHSMRRRSLPDTGRLRRRFSFLPAPVQYEPYPQPGSHYPLPAVWWTDPVPCGRPSLHPYPCCCQSNWRFRGKNIAPSWGTYRRSYCRSHSRLSESLDLAKTISATIPGQPLSSADSREYSIDHPRSWAEYLLWFLYHFHPSLRSLPSAGLGCR